MKLYVLDKKGNGKIFIRSVARSRPALAQKLGGNMFMSNGVTYDVNDVFAEKGSDNTALGMLVGGVIGALGGGPGVAAGGFIGALLGKEQDKKEDAEVAEFNGSTA
ncbi:hypothetical protein [Undibacterium luofuense]|uniref:Uncharacterized protein n=1 Tax=Undibacterium luofuense TaxID=2828733 RepID=A0A941DKR8_9BURK|nr:hypothetical protein [Undibacterium luofuense]MBR7781859.1 hypothetical protein [Undibacterium luofuense]